MTSTLAPRRGIPLGLVLFAALLGATGCATPPGTAAPETSSPTVASADVEVIAATVTGEGPTGWPGVEFPIPPGARSVMIDFSCDGDGFYHVELGDSMALGQATISGSCADSEPLHWPLTPRTEDTLSVTVADDVAWIAAPRFSSAEFPVDAAVTADCAAFTDAYSLLVNADTGFVHYAAFDETEWSARVATASERLRELAGSSSSALAAPVAAMADIVAEASEPGAALRGVGDAVAQVNAACNSNQTPFVVNAEFGG